MRKSDQEIEDLSQIIVNTQTKTRSKDLVEISEIIWRLKERFGSVQALSERVGLSTEMIREFLLIRNFPIEIKELVRNREIDSIGTIKEIATIKSAEEQTEFARQAIGLKSSEVRSLKQLVKYGKIPIKEARQLIVKERSQKAHFVVVLLDDDIFYKISTLSSKKGIDESTFIAELVKDHVKGANKK